MSDNGDTVEPGTEHQRYEFSGGRIKRDVVMGPMFAIGGPELIPDFSISIAEGEPEPTVLGASVDPLDRTMYVIDEASLYALVQHLSSRLSPERKNELRASLTTVEIAGVGLLPKRR